MIRKISLVLLVIAAVSPALADEIGMVLDTRGTVTAQVKGKARALEITDPLPSATTIVIAGDAELSFVFYPTREMYSARGPAELRIEGAAVQVLKGAAPTVRKLPENQSRAAQGYQGRVLPAALVMKSAPSRKLPPRVSFPLADDVLLAARPEFAWTVVDDRPVTASLFEGPLRVFEQSVAGTRLTLPDGLRLKSGPTYTLRVVTAEGAASSVDFRLAPPEQVMALHRMRPGEDAAAAEWTLYALALEQAQAFSEARRIWERLLRVRPESAALKELAQ